MKYFQLLFAVFFLTACSKEDLIGPSKLQPGQEVEVAVSDRYGAIEDPLLLLPSNKPAEMSLAGFMNREPGYNYRVKAKLVKPAEPPQDGAAYWLEFIEVLRKEKNATNVPFDLAVIQSFVPGGPIIRLTKAGDKYYFDDKVTFTYANNEVRYQLEEIWLHKKALYESWQSTKTMPSMKWKAIKATVSHDPQHFGKSYLVSKIEFTE